MKVGADRLVGNQVSLHATKRIPSRFLRDDGKHKGTFGDEVVNGEKRRDWDWWENKLRYEIEGEGEGIEKRKQETEEGTESLPYRYLGIQYHGLPN